jgi:hypothetical protein
MTEAEWLASTDYGPMMEFLLHKVSARKKRLLACGCCRVLGAVVADERSRAAVTASERFADGQADLAELNRAGQAAREAWEEKYRRYRDHSSGVTIVSPPGPPAEWTALYHAERSTYAVMYASLASMEDTPPSWDDEGYIGLRTMTVAYWQGPWHAALAAFSASGSKDISWPGVALIHDLFGNPFRPVAFDPTWLTWNDGVAVKLAQAVYDDHAFDRLPILADALEEAGCGNTDILDHCRQPRVHVRGCWLVDLLLGKE